MNTTFIIPGGAGKVVTAIPALEKYHRLNPHDDFKVIPYSWETFYYSNPVLQKRVFNAQSKGTFLNHIKDNKAVVIDPYTNYHFYNQKCNLIEAFDKEINNTDYHEDLTRPYLGLTNAEQQSAIQIIQRYKENTGKNKTIMFQPFGSGTAILNDTLVDDTNRSLNYKTYIKIVEALSEHATIIYASSPQFKSKEDKWSISFDEEGQYHRVLLSLTKNVDYFVGIDSVGQHVAYSYNIPGLIIGGGTNDINFGYPNHFKIFRKNTHTPSYLPWSLPSHEDFLSGCRENDGIMNFSDIEIKHIIDIILRDIYNA